MAGKQTYYLIKPEFDVSHRRFKIMKYATEEAVGGLADEEYTVDLGDGEPLTVMDESDVVCSCIGFRMQRADKRTHKHVAMAVIFERMIMEAGGDAELQGIFVIGNDKVPMWWGVYEPA